MSTQFAGGYVHQNLPAIALSFIHGILPEKSTKQRSSGASCDGSSRLREVAFR